MISMSNDVLNQIQIGTKISPNSFSTVAEDAAKMCSASKDKNKVSQIRKFYDELVIWENRVTFADNPAEKFEEVAPYIQMLKAKVSYASGRQLVTSEFKDLLVTLISEVKNPVTLKQAKLFFEAFIGFR